MPGEGGLLPHSNPRGWGSPLPSVATGGDATPEPSSWERIWAADVEFTTDIKDEETVLSMDARFPEMIVT